MTTGVREFTGKRNLAAAQRFSREKATQGYNVGAERFDADDDDKVLYAIYWSVGFLDLNNLHPIFS